MVAQEDLLGVDHQEAHDVVADAGEVLYLGLGDARRRDAPEALSVGLLLGHVVAAALGGGVHEDELTFVHGDEVDAVRAVRPALLQDLARHEHLLEGSLANLSHALLHMNRSFGQELGDEGEVYVLFDDSIISDTAAEKAQDMAEVGVTMHAWEYRMKWYGEDEKTTKARADGLRKQAGTVADSY